MSGIEDGIDGPTGFPAGPATHPQDPQQIHLQHMADRDAWQSAQDRDGQALFDGFQERPRALPTGQPSTQQVSQGLMQYHAAQTSQIAAMQTGTAGPINNFPQPNANPANNARSIKRPRPVKSCSECRKRKLKCNRGMPCAQCNKSRRLCRYSGDGNDGFSDGSEEERERERPSKKVLLESTTGGSAAEVDISGTPGRDGNTVVSARRPSSVLQGPVREERIGLMRNGEFVSLEDLVTRLERLEQALGAESPARTDNSGSKMINAASPKTIRQLTIKSDALRTRFFGQNSPRVLVNLFPQAKSLLNTRSGSLRELFIKLENLHKLLQDAHRTRVAPIPVFVESMISTAQRMKDLLPPPDVCKRLVQTYFETSEVVFRFLHIPSFWQKVEMYFNQQFNVDAHAYFLPQLLATVAIGSRFAAEGNGMTRRLKENAAKKVTEARDSAVSERPTSAGSVTSSTSSQVASPDTVRSLTQRDTQKSSRLLPRNDSFSNIGGHPMFSTRPPSRSHSRNSSVLDMSGSFATLDSKEGFDEATRRIHEAMSLRRRKTGTGNKMVIVGDDDDSDVDPEEAEEVDGDETTSQSTEAVYDEARLKTA